jgi:hypothetical protein
MIDLAIAAYVILSFPSRVERSIRWKSLGLYIMIILQYITIKTVSGTWAAALHSVIAIFLFLIAVHIVKGTRRWLFARAS